jgi:Arc/MetJ-type ribon-helix-helix transcriptional regulator
MNVEIPPELEEFVQRVIRQGTYDDVRAVVSEALHLLTLAWSNWIVEKECLSIPIISKRAGYSDAWHEARVSDARSDLCPISGAGSR